MHKSFSGHSQSLNPVFSQRRIFLLTQLPLHFQSHPGTVLRTGRSAQFVYDQKGSKEAVTLPLCA